jgi:chromosome segregation ATPase
MTPWWVTLVIALGGSAGVVALIRLFWLEPKVARQDEVRSLWSENRAQRVELDTLRAEANDRDDRLVELERHLMKCEADRERLTERLTALEGR